jgi:hypothetical protein
MSKFKVIVCKKPKHNKLRYIANEKLQPQSPLNDGEVLIIGEPKYIGEFPQHRDIEVLPADPDNQRSIGRTYYAGLR